MTTPSDAGRAGERESWARCTGTLFGRCNDGRMQPWLGTDGHSGCDRFYTCDRCGMTS